jgi:vacuolar-type H+-ATPase subunit C/Vma6
MNGVMLTKGYERPKCKRSIKNAEYEAIGGATLRDNGIYIQFPKYFLEEVGRWVKSGRDFQIVAGLIGMETDPKILCGVLKARRTKESPDDIRITKKITLPLRAWEVIETLSKQEGISVSEEAENLLKNMISMILKQTGKL